MIYSSYSIGPAPPLSGFKITREMLKAVAESLDAETCHQQPTTNNCSNWGNLVTNYSRTVDIKWQATSQKKITDLKNRGNISQLEWTHTHPTHTTTWGSPLGRAWQMNSDVEMNGLVLLDMSDMKFLDWHVCLPCLIAKKHPLNNCWAIWLKLGKWDHNASSSWQSFKLWL